MAFTTDDSDGYVPSSGDSEDEGRPNRWEGPSSTWQQLNNAEIDTTIALNAIRNQDLSIHLYNAFALKQRHSKAQVINAPVAGKDINAVTGQTIEQDAWVPHRSWTAWPMRADKVPHQTFMKRTDDADEKYTLRKAVREMPSTALEETLAAAVLRTAKDKFKARPCTEIVTRGLDSGLEGDDDESDTDAFSTTKRARAKSMSTKRDSATENGKMEIDDIQAKIPLYVPLQERCYKPIVATDDDLSHAILRPSIRHVLSKLERTLTILHNAQDSMLNYQSDSADSEASDSSRRGQRSSRSRSQPGTRKRGRPPKSREPSQVRRSVPLETPEHGKKKAGRPRKVYPRLADETDQEYTIRVARLRKEPVPFFAEPDTEPGLESRAEPVQVRDPDYSAGSEGDGSAAEGIEKKPKIKRKRAREQSPEMHKGTPSIKGKGRARIGLRDWRDILGAAALAGFPAPVLDRTARRCANLFGQPTVLHTLPEAPPTGRTSLAGKITTCYEPGMPLPPLLPPSDSYEDKDEDKDEKDIALHIARLSRSRDRFEENPAAAAASRRSLSRGRPRTPAGSRRSRSRSAVSSSAGGGAHFCPFADCPRAVDGFTRRPNMIRHMKLVHGVAAATASASIAADSSGGIGGAGAGAEDEADVDSEDEMYGAVHVDGFLRPIKVRPGWRAGDVSEEPRRRGRSRGRGRRGGEEDRDGDGDGERVGRTRVKRERGVEGDDDDDDAEYGM
ncbi:RNA polymerase I-specific transcription initiation factor-domain-containing protein [Biscogniauxia sp. FL1348]|nr:RNA polymerase I-specific transcription initiation factor-domain-containing protein [Biscogniauxia sp. FL1348]